ncbi:LOW QUALITY PROTEIN: snRNA-activating protein complex subunit 4 [Fundulus diaphanus]
MSDPLSAQRDQIQREVEELERSLAVTQDELDLLSSETDDGSGNEDETDQVGQVGQSPRRLLAQREKIQTEIQNLENMLGSHSPISVSSDDSSSSSDESDLDLPPSVDSCLQLNLVYQQVIQETLDHLETLLAHNQKQQKELMEQISGPVKESSRECSTSYNQHPSRAFLGSFLKPYFRDRLTGLVTPHTHTQIAGSSPMTLCGSGQGPPANQEAKLKAQRMAGCPDDGKLRMKRWEGWQKSLLIHSVTRDHLKKLIQPKMSRLDFLTKKLSSAQEAERQQLTEQIDCLEKEIQLLRKMKEEELTGDRYEEHDWQKISNIDFEGRRDAEDIRLFWQNFLHPSINKSPWSNEEVQLLNEVVKKHEERHWEKIAEELGTGRTAFMCLQMYQRFVSNSLKRGNWTPEEDNQLRELIQKMRIGNFIPYTQISYFIKDRDTSQLIYRWNQVLDPSLKRGPWTKDEDQLLLQAVARHGERCWWKVRLEVPGRTDGACRDRYVDCLRKNIKKGSFDSHEVELLKELVKKHGVGRWAKIAAEIPHRLDSQCLREWRKLIRLADQDPEKKVSKTCRKASGGRGVRKKAAEGRGVRKKAAAKGRIRRLLRIKEEEEQMTDEEEEEEVQYMDTDDEKTVSRSTEVKQEEYIIPPMEEWIPAETKQTSSVLNIQPAALPSSSQAQGGPLVRSTVLDRSGTSVIIGPPPRELPWEQRHSFSAMMMASRDTLRLHFNILGHKLTAPRVKGVPPAAQNQDLLYKLQAAVTPWIGNLLIAKSQAKTAADVLRERGEQSGVSTTSIFLLLLRAMNVDTLGCKEMIEQRRNRLAQPPSQTPGPKRRRQRTTEPVQNPEVQKKEDPARQLLQQVQEAVEGRLVNPNYKQRRLILPGPLQSPQLLLQRPPQSPQLLLQRPPQSSQLLLQRPPQSSQLLLQRPPQSSQLLLQRPPQSPQLLLQRPPQSSQLLLQRPPQSSQLLLQRPPQSPQLLLQSSSFRDLLKALSSSFRDLLKDLSSSFRGLLKALSSFFRGLLKALSSSFRGLLKALSSSFRDLLKALSSSFRLLLTDYLCTAPNSTRSNSAGREEAACGGRGGANAGPSRAGSEGFLPGVDHTYACRLQEPCQRDEAAPKAEPGSVTTACSPGSPTENRPSVQAAAASTETAVHQEGGRKRRWVEGAGAIQEGKRLRKPSLKIREAADHQAAEKKKRSSASSRRSQSKERPRTRAPPAAPAAGFSLVPSPSMWAMMPVGPTPLVQAPPPALPNAPLLACTAPPTLTAGSSPIGGLTPGGAAALKAPRPSPVLPSGDFKALLPPVMWSPDLSPTPSLAAPPTSCVLPGVVGAGPMLTPPLQNVGVNFDYSLISLEPPEVVRDWLSGRGGVSIPGTTSALPYLPPFVSTLSTLSALLRAKKSLTTSSLQLLSSADKPPGPQTPSGSTCSASEEPDSISEPRPAEQQPDQQEEQVKAVRQLVAERFSSNPAYQLLKARFLSCFTLPAFLASMPPPTNKEEEEEDEEEEEEELKKIRERGRKRRAQRSMLVSDDSAASASYYSGICNTKKPSTNPDPVPQNQQPQTEEHQQTEFALTGSDLQPNQPSTNQSQSSETG